MTEPGPTPQARIKQGRHVAFSYIWLAPVIAAAVGGFLFYKSEIDVGPTITIIFEDGARISTKAKVVYRGVQVGAVQSVALDASLGHVNVTAQLDKSATELAREGSQFWLVEPRVSFDEISGLSTLMSGSYIQVAPGSGKPTRHFVGLTEPPIVAAGQKELSLILEADDAGSLAVNSTVSYRGIRVGAVTGVALPDDGTSVRIGVAIKSKYAALVRSNTVFWRTSGIQVDLNPLEPNIGIDSLASLIRGGVSFGTLPGAGEAVSARAVFELLDDRPNTVEMGPPTEGLKLILTTKRAGIANAAPVYYRRLQVGKVLQSKLNQAASAVEIEVVIEPEHAALVNSNSVFWNASGVQMDLDLTNPKIDVESLQALLAGGIAFASRGTGEPVKTGATFALLDREPGRDTASPGPTGRRFVLVADEPGSIAEGDPVYYRQVQVGQVRDIELLPDGSAVAVTIDVEDQHAALVRQRSVFWNASGVHANLNLFDPSIDVESAKALLRGGIAFATPADGGPQAAANTEFRLYSETEGRKRAQPKASGLHVVLTASQLGSVAVGDSVYYREVEVGEVVATGFEDNSASVRIHAVIDNRYAPLVREDSVFWNASGLHVDFSLFKGASLNVESLKALLAGGVAFATPQTQAGARAADGSHFPLHDKPEDVWLTWQPAIPLGPRQAEPRLPKIETATSGFSVEDMAPTPYVATTASHVRRGPGAGYGIIETLAKDTTVEVTGKAMGLNWYRISLADGGVGYVWGKLLQPADRPAAQ